MPEEVIPTSTPTVNGTDPSAAAVINPARTAIINKYEQTYFGDPAATTETVAADPVVVEPPAPTVTPVVPAGPDLAVAMQALLDKVTSLESKIAQPQTPTVIAQAESDWLQLLSEGKKVDGEKALAKALGPGIQQQAVQQALAIMQSERAINEFVSEIRTKNPDLTPMEPYIALAADARIRAAQAAGKVNSPADYVNVYKEAVSAEIEAARNLTRTFQGVGKTQATTRIAEVAASPTLKPNAVNLQREAPAQAQPEAAETPESYLAKRQANHARLAGMGS